MASPRNDVSHSLVYGYGYSLALAVQLVVSEVDMLQVRQVSNFSRNGTCPSWGNFAVIDEVVDQAPQYLCPSIYTPLPV